MGWGWDVVLCKDGRVFFLFSGLGLGLGLGFGFGFGFWFWVLGGGLIMV